MKIKSCALIVLIAGIIMLQPQMAFSAGSLQTTVILPSSGTIQQNQTGTYSYIISVSGANYQMKNGTTEQILYQSANPTQVANTAIGNLTQGGGSILFSSGTYNLRGSIIGENKNNVTLDFEKGSLLFVTNNMNAPAIFLNNANNWLIQGVTINGNAANQGVSIGLGENGIAIIQSNNSYVDTAYIYNCRQFGFYCNYNVANDGIINSKILSCGWNGVTLGGTTGFNLALYAINNEVAYCGDVGITNYGFGNIVTGNYIYDMNGTSGYNNANWGIGVEGGGTDLISGNTINNCLTGINLSMPSEGGSEPDGQNIVNANSINNCQVGIFVGNGKNTNTFNTVDSNIITNCLTFGIEVSSDYNTFSENQITQWDIASTYHDAIGIISGNGNQIINNILSSTFFTVIGIELYAGNDNTITGNSITSPSTGGVDAIRIHSGCLRTTIEQNQISGFASSSGINVYSGALNTLIQNNTLLECTGKPIINSGTATSIYTNTGYNPVGPIASPISGTYLLDKTGYSFTWVSGSTYTNWESPKVLHILGGTVSAVKQNGVTLFTETGCTVTLHSGDTFSVTFSATPTINVMGQ